MRPYINFYKFAEAKKFRLGRPGVSLKMGIVGMANIGKSSTFNLISKLNVPAQNYPFCTIQPNTALIKIIDPRFQKLCKIYQPKSQVSPVLKVVDIAGLVKGASEGHGLGNQFLANIMQVDGIYQVVRAFQNQKILHTQGGMNPIRDVEIIRDQLIRKDEQIVKKRIQQLSGKVTKTQDKLIKLTYSTLLKVRQLLKENKQIRCQNWKTQQQVDILNKYLFLTSKPLVYLLNMSKNDFLEDKAIQDQKKFLDIVTYNGKENAKIIKYSVEYEMEQQEKKSKSKIDTIINSGYQLLDIIHFFTVGKDQVKAWAIRKGDTAVQAATQIHTDFAKGFISAEVIAAQKLIQNPQYKQKIQKYMKKQGKIYVVKDGDIVHFNCKFK